MPSATPIQYESTENSPQVIGSGLQQERQRPERGRAAEGQGGGEEGVAEAGGHATHRWSNQMLRMSRPTRMPRTLTITIQKGGNVSMSIASRSHVEQHRGIDKEQEQRHASPPGKANCAGAPASTIGSGSWTVTPEAWKSARFTM